VKPLSSHFSIRKVWKPPGAEVHVSVIPDVKDTGIGLTTIPEAGKVPPDTSTTGAPDIKISLKCYISRC
jgi:hypothetical protein